MEWRPRWIVYAAMVVALGLAGLAARPVHAAADSEQGGPGRGGDGVPPGLAVTTQMRIEGLNGNNPTPVVSFSLGAANTGSTSSGGGGGAGKATFSPLTVSKGLDADSVPLLQAAATGQVLRTVTIEVFNAGTRVPFATYTFEDVLVSSSVIGASGSVDEQDTFDFRRITSDVTVNGQAFHSCFDIKANASCS